MLTDFLHVQAYCGHAAQLIVHDVLRETKACVSLVQPDVIEPPGACNRHGIDASGLAWHMLPMLPWYTYALIDSAFRI